MLMLQCAAMIINEPGGFSEVWYVEQHKDTTGLRLLQSAGIKTGTLDAAGVVRYDICDYSIEPFV